MFGTGPTVVLSEKQWGEFFNLNKDKEKMMMALDVTEELKDLLKGYSEEFERLENKEMSRLDNLITFMESFIDAHKERKRIGVKLANLKAKLNLHESGCEECGCEEEDEE